MKNHELTSLSPLDGHYTKKTEALSVHFSEFTYIRSRASAEIDYLISLSNDKKSKNQKEIFQGSFGKISGGEN